MFSDKKTIVFLAIISSLVIGLIVGYSVGVSKVPELQEIVFDNPATGGNSNIKTVKTDITAKEAYTVALNESRLWPNDTYLSEINLISKKFDEKGLSNGWKVMFYSKSEKKIFEVTIKDGESRGTIVRDASSPVQTLKGELTDSPSLAKIFFSDHPADTEIISLRMYYDESMKKFIWTIFFPKGSQTIDAEL
jgi:hypothetical protein